MNMQLFMIWKGESDYTSVCLSNLISKKSAQTINYISPRDVCENVSFRLHLNINAFPFLSAKYAIDGDMTDVIIVPAHAVLPAVVLWNITLLHVFRNVQGATYPGALEWLFHFVTLSTTKPTLPSKCM